MDGQFARRCRACRRIAGDAPPRSADASRRCSWSATPTPPSIFSAPSTRSTADSQWFDEQRSATPSSNPNELVLETLIPEGPGRCRAARACRSARPRSLPRPRSSPRPAWRSTPASRRACRSATAPTWCFATWPRPKASRSRASKRSSSSSTCSTSMPARAAPRASRAQAGKPVADAPMESLSKAMAEMQSAWKRGDQSVFVRMLDQLRQASPDTYRMMFTERNARWADWITARMQTPGTVFVAVGAGHLAGQGQPARPPRRTAASAPSGSTDGARTLLF